MGKLAINGGTPVRTKPFPPYLTMGEEEFKAAERVIRSGVLSKYLGCWEPDFYGGSEVQAFEKEWAEYFNVKHAIAVNSATSGLYCAIGAAEVGPGDEVIVSPYTMSASATSILIFNGVPVFADIEEDYFCLDPKSVEDKITPFTKAMVVVDIFGMTYDAEEINKIAKKHNLIVIEDAAQSIGAKHGEKFSGTLGDIGVYSLNYHKHIHTGEGGVIVTDNDGLAEKMRLIRNHAEAVVGDKGTANLINMIGFNFRMPEIEAAIGREQLKKMKGLVEERQENCQFIIDGIADLKMLKDPGRRQNNTHAFYTMPLHFNQVYPEIDRLKYIQAVKAEGVTLDPGYIKPLYLYPIFQKQIGYGNKQCPFKCPHYKGTVDYSEGICPVTENLQNNKLITFGLMTPPMTKDDLSDVLNAVAKVEDNIEELL